MSSGVLFKTLELPSDASIAIHAQESSHRVILVQVIGFLFLPNNLLYVGTFGLISRGGGEESRKKRSREVNEGKKLLVCWHHGTASDPLTACKWDLTVHGKYSCLGVCVCVDLTHLWVGQIHGPGEDDPFHYFAAGRRGQRTGVSVITINRWRQQIPQDKWPEAGLFFWVGARDQCWLISRKWKAAVLCSTKKKRSDPVR